MIPSSPKKDIQKALEGDNPDIEKALTILGSMSENDFSPDASHMRLMVIETANAIENNHMTREQASHFLREVADGNFPELMDVEIDLDVPESLPKDASLVGLTLLGRPAAIRQDIPGPDEALLRVITLRDAMVARRIIGETIEDDQINTYQDALVSLGESLQSMTRILKEKNEE